MSNTRFLSISLFSQIQTPGVDLSLSSLFPTLGFSGFNLDLVSWHFRECYLDLFFSFGLQGSRGQQSPAPGHTGKQTSDGTLSQEPWQTPASLVFWHFQELGWVGEESRSPGCLERVAELPGPAR